MSTWIIPNWEVHTIEGYEGCSIKIRGPECLTCGEHEIYQITESLDISKTEALRCWIAYVIANRGGSNLAQLKTDIKNYIWRMANINYALPTNKSFKSFDSSEPKSPVEAGLSAIDLLVPPEVPIAFLGKVRSFFFKN